MGILSAALGLSEVPPEPGPLGDYSADVTPPARSTVAPVTVERALTLPTVYRAIQITAGMAAQLVLNSWRGSKLVDPAPALVTSPDPWRSLDSWIERFVVSLAVDGNAFLRVHRNPDGTVASLEVLNPFKVTIIWRDGVKSYEVAQRKGKVLKLTADEVIHKWALEVPGYDRGLGPIGHCRAALSGVIDVRDYADGWFQTSDVPSGVLSTDQSLDPTAAKEYKRRWLNPDADDPAAGRAGPSVRVLGKGLSYTPIMLKPEEAQWLEAQKFGVLDIARMWGLPADYLEAAVDGNSLTYTNLEMIDSRYLRLTLFPVYLRKIESALTEALPRGQRARFDLGALLRPDAKTRALIDKTYLDAGVIAPAEVRDREGWAGPPPPKPKPPAAPAPAPAPAEEETPA